MSIHLGKLLDCRDETIGIVLFCSTTGLPLNSSVSRLRDWDDTEDMLAFARESGVELRRLSPTELEQFIDGWKLRAQPSTHTTDAAEGD